MTDTVRHVNEILQSWSNIGMHYLLERIVELAEEYNDLCALDCYKITINYVKGCEVKLFLYNQEQAEAFVETYTWDHKEKCLTWKERKLVP